jgi:tRNA-specific 2-thiouridylase
LIKDNDGNTPLRTNKEGAVVALSGGVDSAVAALILLERGWTVRALHLLLPAPEGQAEQRAEKALAIAGALGIEIDFEDLSAPFKEKIIEPFFSSYLLGRTPNPCVLCNAEIKLPALISAARKYALGHVATGHYAVVRRDQASAGPILSRGADRSREQSYFLHRIGREALERVVFPLGEMTKDEVRKKAAACGIAQIPGGESREICFLGSGDYRSFMEGNRDTGGEIVDIEGRPLGRHSGIHLFTIGQRHGLGVASPRPLYVKAIRPGAREVVVCEREGLFGQESILSDWHWCGEVPGDRTIRCSAQIRYRHREALGCLKVLEGGKAIFTFDEPQWAVTPGQALVCYMGERVLGGGWIEEGR